MSSNSNVTYQYTSSGTVVKDPNGNVIGLITGIQQSSTSSPNSILVPHYTPAEAMAMVVQTLVGTTLAKGIAEKAPFALKLFGSFNSGVVSLAVDILEGTQSGEPPSQAVISGTINFATSFAIDLAASALLADLPVVIPVIASIIAYNGATYFLQLASHNPNANVGDLLYGTGKHILTDIGSYLIQNPSVLQGSTGPAFTFPQTPPNLPSNTIVTPVSDSYTSQDTMQFSLDTPNSGTITQKDNLGNIQEITNILINADGSQIDKETMYSGLSSNDSNEIVNFTSDPLGNETVNNTITNFKSGGSQEHLLTGLLAGEAEAYLNYWSANATGTLGNEEINNLDGTSEVINYNPASGLASEQFFYSQSGANGTITDEIYNWTSGGSQEHVLSGLPSGEADESYNYNAPGGIKGGGTEMSEVTTYTNGSSINHIYHGLPAGWAYEQQYFNGPEAQQGTDWEDVISWTRGGSQKRQYTGLAAGEASIAMNYVGYNADPNSLQLDLIDNYTNGTSYRIAYSGGLPSYETGEQQWWTGLYGLGSVAERIVNWARGGSSKVFYTVYGLPSNQIDEVWDYAGLNADGNTAQYDEIISYTDGTSVVSSYNGLPSGVTSMTGYFLGQDASGDITRATVYLSDGYQVNDSYYYNSSNVQTGFQEVFYRGTSDVGYGDYYPDGTFATGTINDNGVAGLDGEYSGDVYEDNFDGGPEFVHNAKISSSPPNILDIPQFRANLNTDPSLVHTVGSSWREAGSVSQNNIQSYQLEGPKWDQGTITWSLADHAIPGELTFSGYMDASYNAMVEKAFQAWAQASGLKFKEVADSAQSDIRIGWGDLNTPVSGLVGFTDYHQQAGKMLAGVTVWLENPKNIPNTSTDPYQVTLHEIGHALGLADNADPHSIMDYQVQPGNDTLGSLDIQGIQKLYGNNVNVNAIIQQMNGYGVNGEQGFQTTSPQTPPTNTLALAHATLQH